MENSVNETARIQQMLLEPFDASEVKFKPQSVKGNRALAVCYIDCRLVQDRLDEVVGVGNWMDEYEIAMDGSVICRLKVKMGGEWVTKTDVGSPSEQPDHGDRLKAAFSDALKRAAVKFGIGRYIYRLGHQWCDYDPVKKQFTQTPRLPNWALPKKQPAKSAPAPYADPTPAAPPAGPTSDDVYKLVEELGGIRQVKPADLLLTVLKATDAAAVCLDDLSGTQLANVAKSLRKRIADERPKGQQTIPGTGGEPARGLPD